MARVTLHLEEFVDTMRFLLYTPCPLRKLFTIRELFQWP